MVEIHSDATELKATPSDPHVLVQTLRLNDRRWLVTIGVAKDFAPGSRATIALTTDNAGEASQFEVGYTPIKLAGMLKQTSGVLALQTNKLDGGGPVATLDWPGDGTLAKREIGSHGYVLFRYQSTNASTPARKIRPPFKDTFSHGDGFWYGDSDGNMRFDIDGIAGHDEQRRVFFGSVNSNAGTVEKGPEVSWKIEVEDNNPHVLTLFSPGQRTRGAQQSVTIKAADGSSQMLRFDGSQGGVVMQFEFVGNVSLTLAQSIGGMGAPTPGGSAAALFLD
jgi:hypothetical protein